MARIVVTEFVTLDGVFEDPGGSEGIERGGWAFQFERGEDGDKFKLDETMNSDALLLGRVTYEEFAKPGLERDGEFADKFNDLTKYVVSSTLSDPGRGATRRSSALDEIADAAGAATAATSSSTAAAARPSTAGEGSGRRAAPDGLPGRPRERQAPAGRDVARRSGCASWSRGRSGRTA